MTLGHAGHWAGNLIYLAPVLVIVGALVVNSWRERRAERRGGEAVWGISVVLCASDRTVQQALRADLRGAPDILVVSSTRRFAEVEGLVDIYAPDVVVLGRTVDDEQGPSLVAAALQARETGPAIVVVGHQDGDRVVAADGPIVTPTAREDADALIAAVRHAIVS